MKRLCHIASLILNLLLGVMVAVIALNAFFGWWAPLRQSLPSGAMAFSDFTLDAALLFMVSAFITFAFDIVALTRGAYEIPHWVRSLKLVAVATLVASLLFSLVYIYPLSGESKQDPNELINVVDTLWIRVLLPTVALVSFMTVEHETRLNLFESLLAIVPSAVYFASLLPLIYASAIGDPYPILEAEEPTNLMPVIYGLVIILGVFLVALLIIPIRNRIDRAWSRGVTIASAESAQLSSAVKRAEAAGQESAAPAPAEEPEPSPDDSVMDKPAEEGDGGVQVSYADEDSEEEEERKERQEAEELRKKGPGFYNGRARVYHISRQKDGVRWQVRLATGKRAIRLFPTQKEALAFAKELCLRNGGSIRIHSLKGRMRKEK